MVWSLIVPTLQAGICRKTPNPGLTTWASMLRPFRAMTAASGPRLCSRLVPICGSVACRAAQRLVSGHLGGQPVAWPLNVTAIAGLAEPP